MVYRIAINIFLFLVVKAVFGQDTIPKDLYQTGVEQLKTGLLREALESFTSVIKMNPKEMNAYYNRGIVNFQLGDKKSACLDWNHVANTCDSEALNMINTKCDSVFSIAEVMPEFPGGPEKLFEYLHRNMHYPVLTKDDNLPGRIYVGFVINISGNVEDAKILRGANQQLNEEVLRVVNEMPQWTPGKICGRLVKVRYNLPINIEIR